RDAHGASAVRNAQRVPDVPGRCAGTISGEPRAAPRRSVEDTISVDKTQSWVFTEEFLGEDDVLLRARERADQLGCTRVVPGSCAVPTVLAAAVQARSVVEIGTGAGVASMYLLRGMPADGVLTTIDLEVEHQRAAKEAFREAEVRATRTRAISGRA